MLIYDKIMDIFLPFIAISISLIALFISIIYSKRNLKLQILNDIMNEYSRKEMGEALNCIWEFFDIDCKSNEKILIKKYIKKYKTEKNDKNNSLHHKRRLITQFYIKVSKYYINGLIPKSSFKKLWSKHFQRIVEEVLKPIELKAIPEIINKHKVNNKKQFQTSEEIYNMFYFYDKLYKK